MIKKAQTGGEAIISFCEQQGVTHIFGYPGGANIPLFDALIDSKIALVLARHEQGAAHMADGYARASGKAGVVLVTSGPGATNAITGVMTAHMDSVPLVVLCGQTVSANLGLDAFQEADISGISYPVVKHSYLLKNAHDIPRVMKEAFYLAESGRPGPVLIDIPKDISSALFEPDWDAPLDLPGYQTVSGLDASTVATLTEKLRQAKRPVLLVGHGVLIANAEKEALELAEKARTPVVTTLLGKGAFPETHPLSLGMLGMHGTAYANKAVEACDFILSIGSRWDDRIIGNPETFCRNAYRATIDIDSAEHNKTIPVDLFIHGDAREALREISARLEAPDTVEWLSRVNAWRSEYPLAYSNDNGLTAQCVIDAMYKLTMDKDPVVVTDVGQHQMWAAQFFLNRKPHTWISSGGAGTMGFGFPAALGAQLACPDAMVIAIVGDGGFQMTLFELSTARNHALPVKILILDNKYLGMVRQWQNLFFDNRLSGVFLEGNPDFVALAEAYGVKGFHISAPEQVESTLREAIAYNGGPCLIHAEVALEENVFPMIPAGAGYEKMLTEAPSQKLEKPKGSA